MGNMFSNRRKPGKMRMQRKAQIWISVVLYVLIAAVVMVIVLEAGIPLLEGMRDRAVFEKTKDSMITLDQHVRDVADEGLGSQRSVPVEIQQGEFIIEDDRLKWEMDSKSKILEPRTHVSFGNVIVASNVDVRTTDYGSFYTLENSRLKANISSFGSPENHTSISLSSLIRGIKLKETGTTLTGTFSFEIGNSCTSGTGWTELVPHGNNSLLGDAEVVVHMNPNSTSCSYDLELILESQADFLRVDIRNFRP
ncbi:hypothetical protein GF351_02555 [Candidatus Woesearchaeota archaeon]|nr:hypothetical protein [Candidatus Woesearchaeota archaeon]